ncbi:MAG TPA: hypothetical protein VFD75_15095 [Pyrinomonadaceae bacterium]|nr:hypothetical protein [Pyrinomonadaceae bacterium]
MTDPSTAKLKDPESLIELHERLLFQRAYPSSIRELRLTERELKNIGSRVYELSDSDVDLAPLDAPDVSGIAGTSVTSNFSYALVRWLVSRFPKQVSIDWDWFDSEDQFGTTMRRFLPLLAEDAMVEAHVPYREWLDCARGRQNEVAWIIERFESLLLNDRQKAELYDSLKLHVTWEFGWRSSRTGMRLPTRKTFFHDAPLIKRRDVSLVKELNAPAIPVKKLSQAEGQKALDLARQTSAVRYRELHGFTFGDPSRVVKADLGRGTEAFVIGVPAEYRLPLRAYHAAFILKNGVPVAYFEGLSLCEHMESGFNLYYTFRDGETAWLYARILRLMRQLLGVTVFSIDPYQAGHENEEGIESGAFWFYRKLGFRPVKPEILKLTLAEEEKMATNSSHRTSARTLRKLAAGHMLFEMPGRETREWDRFEARNIGFAVERRMVRDFGGDLEKLRRNIPGLATETLRPRNETQMRLFNDLAVVLSTAANIGKWSRDEMNAAAKVFLAKGGADEAQYLKQMQKHALLRALLIKLGCRQD